MGRKAWFLVFGGVLALHAGAFLVMKDRPVIPPEWLVDRSAPEATFRHGEAKFIDPQTGEKMIVQEFTVPTKLAEAGYIISP